MAGARLPWSTGARPIHIHSFPIPTPGVASNHYISASTGLLQETFAWEAIAYPAPPETTSDSALNPIFHPKIGLFRMIFPSKPCGTVPVLQYASALIAYENCSYH
jgi:hypothetical protein